MQKVVASGIAPDLRRAPRRAEGSGVMDMVLLVLAVVLAAVAAAAAVWAGLAVRARSEGLSRRDLDEATRPLVGEIGAVKGAVESSRGAVAESLQGHREEVRAQRVEVIAALVKQQEAVGAALTGIRTDVANRLIELQASNQKKLDEIRGTVDQKLNETLQTRLGEAFKQVSERLEQLHGTLGHVGELAKGVNSLHRTLQGVKTRGVFGETMLAALLEDFLEPTQYERNFAPAPRGGERVEFAVRLPGSANDSGDEPVYLPIDAKFPRDSYERMLQCVDAGDLAGADAEHKALVAKVESFARDIRDKYIKDRKSVV